MTLPDPHLPLHSRPIILLLPPTPNPASTHWPSPTNHQNDHIPHYKPSLIPLLQPRTPEQFTSHTSTIRTQPKPLLPPPSPHTPYPSSNRYPLTTTLPTYYSNYPSPHQHHLILPITMTCGQKTMTSSYLTNFWFLRHKYSQQPHPAPLYYHIPQLRTTCG